MIKTNRLVSAVLSLCIISAAVSAVSAEGSEGIVDSGVCGKNAVWTLDSEGTFTVSGSGDMWSWDFGTVYLFNGDISLMEWDDFEVMPWFDSRDKIKRVIIEDGITSIGNVTFWDCDNLISVEIASSVKIIEGSFECCDKLADIVIPDGVESVSWGSYLWCASMTTVKLPQSVCEIGLYAFDGMEMLSKIVIGNPQCSIYDSIHTINNISYMDSDTEAFAGTIIGYKDSTAQAYAEKYGISFAAIEDFSLGDVNFDGSVTPTDAALALSEYANAATMGTGTFTELEILFADYNGDGKITPTDAASILSFYADSATAI